MFISFTLMDNISLDWYDLEKCEKENLLTQNQLFESGVEIQALYLKIEELQAISESDKFLLQGSDKKYFAMKGLYKIERKKKWRFLGSGILIGAGGVLLYSLIN